MVSPMQSHELVVKTRAVATEVAARHADDVDAKARFPRETFDALAVGTQLDFLDGMRTRPAADDKPAPASDGPKIKITAEEAEGRGFEAAKAGRDASDIDDDVYQNADTTRAWQRAYAKLADGQKAGTSEAGDQALDRAEAEGAVAFTD